MKDILSMLYDTLNADKKNDNPFETKQSEKYFTEYYDTYIKPNYNIDYEKADKENLLFLEMLDYTQKNSI